MKKYSLFIILPLVIIAFLIIRDLAANNHYSLEDASEESEKSQNQSSPENQKPFQTPIDRAGERITKKPFGIFVTPENSPVSPEKFHGFHTAADFEAFSEENDSEVPIRAVTGGKIISKNWASGYGGVLVQSATLNNQPITIIYGHLNLDSIEKNVGDTLMAGEKIGILGKGYSEQTDDERKHLHLGIHKGENINILGYIQNKNQLEEWINPVSVLDIKD